MASTAAEPALAQPELSDADFRVGDQLGYVLGRSAHLASARLNLQHFLWQRILRMTLHPRIPLRAGGRVADVATGTAQWAIEVAQGRPDTHVDGFDVDLSHAPGPGWRPRNLALAEWDLFTEPPSEMQGRYDVVHVRLLVLVLSGRDPLAAIRRLLTLLKPGGWLQWEDLDATRMHVKRTAPDTPSPALDALLAMSRSGGRHDWVAQLPDLLTQAGFVHPQMQAFDDPPELSRALNDVSLMAMEEFAASLREAGKDALAHTVLDLVRAGHPESAGATLCYPRVCCIAQKPAA